MTGPTPDAIQSALRKVLASRPFQGSERMSRFLRFVVDHALSEQPAPLKEHLLAEHVFDRDGSFDPRTDTIVRVEARRLRSKLKEYYADEGRNDPVIVGLGERGYAPVFELRPQAASKPSFAYVKVVLAIGALLAAGAAAWWATTHRTVDQGSIAVLPFANLSGNPENDFFSDGLTEEIISAVASVPQLRVVARTSVFQFKGRGEDVRKIGRDLGVKTVLEGSVRKEGSKIRVTAQLVSVSDGMHLWSETYDRELVNAIEIEGEIARSIAKALGIQPGRKANEPLRRAETNNAEAHELYLKGRYFFYKGTPPDLKKSIEYMERAIALDPGYATAYAGLADAYWLWIDFGLEPPQEARAKAKGAAQTALRLDGDSAEGHFVMGGVLAGEWNWEAAEREYRRALDLKPSLGHARSAYAVFCLGPQRRYQEAIAQLRQVVADDPLLVFARALLGQTLAYAGQPDVAIAELNRALEIDAGFIHTKLALAQAYLDKSEYPKALEVLRTSTTDISYHAGLLGYTHAKLGNRVEVERILRELQGRPWPPPVDVAGIYSGLGDDAQALQWLDRGYEQSSTCGCVVDDPRFRNLHSDPRFTSLLKRMRLIH